MHIRVQKRDCQRSELGVPPSATFFNAEIMRAEWTHPIAASMLVRDLVNIKNPPDSGSGGYFILDLTKRDAYVIIKVQRAARLTKMY